MHRPASVLPDRPFRFAPVPSIDPPAPAFPLRVAMVAGDMPALGGVLCQVRVPPPLPVSSLARWAAAADGRLPLPDHPWLHGLPRMADVLAHVAIDRDGPRERLDFVDTGGGVLMRVWLLPDSDFCAWDQLLARHAVAPRAPETGADVAGGWWARYQGRRGGMRQWRAALVRFTVQRVAGMRLLGLAPAAMSPLARRHAEQLAGGLRLHG